MGGERSAEKQLLYFRHINNHLRHCSIRLTFIFKFATFLLSESKFKCYGPDPVLVLNQHWSMWS